MLDKLDAPILGLHQELLGHVSNLELKTLNKILETARSGIVG